MHVNACKKCSQKAHCLRFCIFCKCTAFFRKCMIWHKTELCAQVMHKTEHSGGQKATVSWRREHCEWRCHIEIQQRRAARCGPSLHHIEQLQRQVQLFAVFQDDVQERVLRRHVWKHDGSRAGPRTRAVLRCIGHFTTEMPRYTAPGT